MATVIRGDDNWDTSIPSNVVSTTSQTQTNVGTSFADVSGAAVTITPSSTSSKVLVTFSAGGMSNGTGDNVQVRILRGGTTIRSVTRYGYQAASGWNSVPIAVNFLDSPSTTSATTYKLQMLTETDNDFRINADQSQQGGMAGIVSTATEIGG